MAVKTPSTKPKQTDRTPPPRSRKLSIENGTTVTAGGGPVNREEEKKEAKTPATSTRSRRLSLEGPRNFQKDPTPMKSPEPITKIAKPGVRSSQIHSQLDQRAPLSPLKSPIMKIDTAKMSMKSPEPITKIAKPEVRSLHIPSQLDQKAPPRSPLKSPIIKIDTAKMKVAPLQTPRTPEPQTKPRIEIQSTTHGKGSQIRKSLRTIGKFINGSDKR